MSASDRWNLSTDYYDVLPADSEMDGDENECDHCGGLFVNDDYYVSIAERCDCDVDM